MSITQRFTARRARAALVTTVAAGAGIAGMFGMSGIAQAITAVMSGTANVNAENFSGTFTINWPAGSGFNPSNGNLTVTEANGLENVSGTVTSGFDTGTALT